MGKISLKDKAYNEIRERIMNGELKPNDAFHEVELAKSIGMSRTPVREALFRLENDGLIHITQNKGAIVTKLDLNDIIQISQARAALEGMSARLACGRIDQGWLIEIETKLNQEKELYFSGRKTEQEFINNARPLGDMLHKEILHSSGNNIILKLTENFMFQFKRVMAMSREVKGRHENALGEHLRIIEALKSNNPALAQERMQEHIINVQNDVVKSYTVL